MTGWAILAEPVVCPTCDEPSWIDRPCRHCVDRGPYRHLGWFSGFTADEAVGFAHRAYAGDGYKPADVEVIEVLPEWDPKRRDYFVALVGAGRFKGGDK